MGQTPVLSPPFNRFEHRLVEDIWVLIPALGINGLVLSLCRDVVNTILLQVHLEGHSILFCCKGNDEGQATILLGHRRKVSEYDGVNQKAVQCN